MVKYDYRFINYLYLSGMIKAFGTGKYYLYRHISNDGVVFYVGIGTKWKKDLLENRVYYYRRAFEKGGHSLIWKRIANNGYSVEIILETDDRDFLFNKEIEFIKLYGKLVNNSGTLTNLYDGGNTGYAILSANHKKKISTSKKGVKQDKIHVETRRKSLIKKYNILQFNWDGVLINQFDCPLDASKATGMSMSHIMNGVLNKVKYTKDYIWMYKLGFTKSLLKKKILEYKKNWALRTNGCSKTIIQYDENYNAIKEWKSLTQIREELRFDKGNIVNAIKYDRLANNCYWKFK